MVAHVYNPSTKEVRQEDHRRILKCKSCPGYIRDPIFKKKHSEANQEAGAGGHQESQAATATDK